MSFIEKIKERARTEIKTIVLPEATDSRILEAAQIVKNEGYAKININWRWRKSKRDSQW